MSHAAPTREPAKQVERRMMIELLQLLSQVGFSINTYQYTGMGSVYYVDFVLFHKHELNLHRIQKKLNH